MITVSIVTYHTSEPEIRECLASLASPCVHRIWVVDNASEQRMEDICRGYGNVEYISLPNPGFGAGHNAAICRSLALSPGLGVKYHLVLNSDVRFEPSILENLEELMDKRPEVGTVQPKVIYPDGRLQHTVRLLPTPWDLIGRRFMPRRWFAGRNSRYTFSHIDHTKEMNVPYHQGSFMFLRLKALRKAGLFDERFFMYPEDIDLTRRLHRNWVTLYWPRVEIVHAHRAGSYTSPRLLWIHIVNMIRYFNKWGWFRDPERRNFNQTLLRSVK